MSQEITFGTGPNGAPVAIPRATLEERHLIARGATGSGKSLWMSSFASQLMTPYYAAGQTKKSPLVIVDLGGDKFMFNYLRTESERLKVTFSFFSLDPRHVSWYFDPLQSCRALAGSPSRQANFIASGLNLIFSEGYGQGYYTRLNYSTIAEAMERLDLRGIESPRLHELANELKRMSRRQRGKDAAEALLALEPLLCYPQLNPDPGEKHQIDIATALEEAHVVYFYLPALSEPLAARAVATLASQSIIIEATHRSNEGLEPRSIYLMQDEFAQIAGGRSLEDALVMCRKMGIQMVLSHQSTAQLKTRDSDLSHVVRDNCAIKLYFTTNTATGQDLSELLSYSKDVVKPRQGQSLRGLTAATNVREVIEPKLERNEIVDVNTTFGAAFLILNDGKGHREPEKLKIIPPTSKAEFERLSNLPLPEKPKAARPKPAPSVQATPKPAAKSGAHSVRQQSLAALLLLLQGEESWK